MNQLSRCGDKCNRRKNAETRQDAALQPERAAVKRRSERHILATSLFRRDERPMRSTRASAAVTRLNARDPEHRYSLGMTASGFFYLLRASSGAAPEKISDDLTLDEFVDFANKAGPQQKAKVSKLDVAFEKQLGSRSGNK